MDGFRDVGREVLVDELVRLVSEPELYHDLLEALMI